MKLHCTISQGEALSPEQAQKEIARWKKELPQAQWDNLLMRPDFQKALADNNSIKVGEIASQQVIGNLDNSRDLRNWMEARKFE